MNADWKLSSTFVIPEHKDVKHVNKVCNRWNKDIIEAAGENYLGGYINYLDDSLRKKRYYGKNLHKLKKLKEKYDPDNVFRRIKGIKSKN